MALVIEEILDVVVQRLQLALSIEEVHKAALVDCYDTSLSSLSIVLKTEERSKKLVQHIIVCSLLLILRTVIVALELKAIELESRTVLVRESLSVLATVLDMSDERSLTVTCITSDDDKLVLQCLNVRNQLLVESCFGICQLVKLRAFAPGTSTAVAVLTLAIERIDIVNNVDAVSAADGIHIDVGIP